jgi:hypothetical protein
MFPEGTMRVDARGARYVSGSDNTCGEPDFNESPIADELKPNFYATVEKAREGIFGVSDTCSPKALSLGESMRSYRWTALASNA